ncbi:hypothetical protein CR152_25890 [Massilia violaceinigra]|uniref:4-fold beta flower domain-containing protein n=1 Tax=Massilia violaceinigra TaxID=2045208 RepID=A0A2D2DRE0_9BURK|nr:hypothetical protein [Massilia violaceinigra]ATQ77548.1 hypothetical protein CR152_25890 [Massilia violaceinigra]
MVTWLYDEAGRASAILDEFCLRTIGGEPAGFVFGLSAFSLKGEHIGWFEDGVFYDVENRILGFLAGARGMAHDVPVLLPPPPEPAFRKRPNVPTLRARPLRRAAGGWSRHALSAYFNSGAPLAPVAALLPAARAARNDLPG